MHICVFYSNFQDEETNTQRYQASFSKKVSRTFEIQTCKFSSDVTEDKRVPEYPASWMRQMNIKANHYGISELWRQKEDP